MKVRELYDGSGVELISNRVFLERPAVEAVTAVRANTLGALTYFTYEIRCGQNATPYSMVTAMGSIGGQADLPAPLPSHIRTGCAVVNRWLADDLDAAAGDTIELTFPVPDANGNLAERKASFKISAIVEMTGIAADPTLMPDFPGLADVADCTDWRPGVPIDLDQIRQKDEDYWDAHRGTPKAFICLSDGQAIWANRFGSLTAVRLAGDDSPEAVSEEIAAHIAPESMGLVFRPVAAEALASADEAMDFGQLFLGLSGFLVLAGIGLMALLLALSADQRSPEAGTLLALGWSKRSVRYLLLGEALLLALVGCGVGCAGGIAYTRAVIWALGTVWSGAVAGTALHFHITARSLLIGSASAMACSAAAGWVVLYSHMRRPATRLLAGQSGPTTKAGRRRWSRVLLVVGVVSIAAAVAMAVSAHQGRTRQAVSVFFGAGSLLLLGSMSLSWWSLRTLGRTRATARLTVTKLSVRNASRRPGRSLAIVGLLACGVFLIVTVAANRRNPAKSALDRSGGTGGFALMAESSTALMESLNSAEGRASLGLSEELLPDDSVVPFRVLQGDDASCLNLARAQQPKLLGVAPEQLARRNAFSFVGAAEEMDAKSEWSLLNEDLGDDVIPAVGDEPTIVWGLALKVGDDLTYTDERGNDFHVRIVGVISSSVLQGSLVVSQTSFERKYPRNSGFRKFLIDAPEESAGNVASAMEKRLADYGMTVRPTGEVLAQFQQIENTYLSIFQALGGLGLILGGAAVAVVAGRNILERRGELAGLLAVGFTRRQVRKLTVMEHAGMVLAGLLAGTVSAVVASVPAISAADSEVPWGWLTVTLAAVAMSAIMFVHIACRAALRGRLLAALRQE